MVISRLNLIEMFLLCFFFIVFLLRCVIKVSRYGCCWDKKMEVKLYVGDGCFGRYIFVIFFLILIILLWSNIFV